MRFYEVSMVGDDYKVIVAANDRDQAKRIGHKAMQAEYVKVNYFDIRAKLVEWDESDMPTEPSAVTVVFVDYDELEDCDCCDDCEDCDYDEDDEDDEEEIAPETEPINVAGIDVVDLAEKITKELTGKDLSHLKNGDFLEVGGYRFQVAGVKPEVFPGQVAVAIMVDTDTL